MLRSIFLILTLGLLLGSGAIADEKLDLVGIVSNEKGEPIPNALVWIYTGQQRDKEVTIMFSGAIAKHQTRTNEKGEFVIPGIDTVYLYNVLVAANDYRSKMHERFDLRSGRLNVVLGRVNSELPARQKMIGQVVDEQGAPVSEARVRISGATQKERVWWGAVADTDLFAFTDREGRFCLTSELEFDQWQLTITAKGFSTLETKHLDTGDAAHRLVLPKGATVRGRILQQGAPVSKHVVGICHTGRSTSGSQPPITGGHFQSATTDADGQFEFLGVVADANWYIFSSLNGPPQTGAITSEEFNSKSSGQIRELGDFELLPTFKISGRVVPNRDATLPKDLAVYADLEFGRGSRKAVIESDGSFAIEGLPQDQIRLRVAYPYRLKSGSHSHHERQYGPGGVSLIIKLEKDLENVELFLD